MRTYNSTRIACYAAYVVQSIVNNLSPLFFVIYQKNYNISYSMISFLLLINFVTQLVVDISSTLFVGRLGYRKSICLANLVSAAGLMFLPTLPAVLPPMAGLTIATMVMAAGSGLIEVLASPLMENLPTKNKAAQMSLLHSFFCWGQVAVVIFSTLFLHFFNRWQFLPFIWAMVPLANFINFLTVPIVEPPEEKAGSIQMFLKSKTFLLLWMVMLCGGACEIAMNQWSSLFAEQALSLPKVWGDLLGPCGFAVFMGSGRVLYGIFGKKINIHKALTGCGILCLCSYALTALSPWPAFSLIGCMLCGLSVSLMWPGCFSLSTEKMNNQGTAMFALLAMGGDLGCSLGPWFTGILSDLSLHVGLKPEGLRFGLLCMTIFPAILLLGLRKIKKETV